MLSFRRRPSRKLASRHQSRVESLESRQLLSATDVLINEIMYHPGPTNTGGEFVEIFNRGDSAVSMDGWKLSDAIEFTFGAETTIGPGEYLVVTELPEAAAFYSLANTAGQFERALNNAGERIALEMADGTLIDEVEYDDNAPWVTSPDGSGPSLELIDPNLDNGLAASWAAGQLYSPETLNNPDVDGQGGDIVINEIMYRPEKRRYIKPIDPFANQAHWRNGSDPDGEYLELFNRGDSTVDMSNWQLLDSGGVLYDFGDVASLESGQYLVVAGNAQAIQDRYGIANVVGNFDAERALSNNGEPITLIDAAGQLVDSFHYGDSSPWPIAPDQLSVSMEVIDPHADNSDPANWRTSRAPRPTEPTSPTIGEEFYITTGTPGAANSVLADAMAAPKLTAVTFYAADSEGTVITAERWNTLAPHPAWDVYVAEGAIPGGSAINNQTGADSDRFINQPLSMGDNTFTFAVSHQPTGDLGFDHYGLNVFVNGNPTAMLDEDPQISGLVMKDTDGPGNEPDHTGNTAGLTMGFPLADLPGAGLVWTDGDYTVEMTDYFVYSKYDGDGNDNGPDFDELSTGSNAGPFVADGNQDVVGQFTLTVVPKRASAMGLPPFIARDDIQHSPIRPTSTDSIKITASNIASQSAVVEVSLSYEIFVTPYQNASETQTIAMRDDGQGGDEVAGDGQYTAVIPPMVSQSLLRYRVTAKDVDGRVATYPDEAEPNPNKAVFSYDGEEDTAMNAYFLILPSSTHAALNRDLWTHEYHEATIVIDGIVYDHVGVHYRGRGWRVHPKKSYKVQFNKTEFFRGMNRLDLAMHFPTMQNMVHNLFYDAGAPTMGSEPIRMYRNGKLFGLMLAQESPNRQWLDAIGRDPNGEVYKASSAPNYSRTGFTGNIMADLDHFDDPDVYPRIWEKKGDSLGSYDSLIELTDIIANTPEDQIYDRLSEAIELDAWLSAWAVHVAGGNGDVVGTNYLISRDSGEDAKWKYHAFDYSHFFGCQMLDFVDAICNPYTQDPYLYFNHFHFRVMENDQLRNRFMVILKDVLENQMRPSQVNALIEQTWARYETDRLDEVDLRLPGPPTHYVVHAEDREEMKQYYADRNKWLLETWIPQQGITLPDNQHPTIRLGVPITSESGTTISWTYHDNEDDAATVDLFWTDGQWNHYVPIPEAQNLAATDGSFMWTSPPGTVNEDIFVQAVIRDGVSDLVGRDRSVKPGPPEAPRLTFENGNIIMLQNPNATGEIYFTVDGSDPRSADGEIAPTAVAYTGPTTVDSISVVRARVRSEDLGWSDAVQDLVVVGAPTISEVMYNPRGGSSDFEFIEIFDPHATPIDMSNMVVAGRGTLFNFATSDFSELAPGQYILLVRNLGRFNQRYDTTGMTIVGEFRRSLSNTRQSIDVTLLPSEMTFIDFTYTDDWYPETDGIGNSLVLADQMSLPSTWSSGDAWRPSIAIDGSPGRADTADPDINGDQNLNASDIDLLCNLIESGDLQYDFWPDGTMNLRDLRAYVENILGTTIGDANLDGRFDNEDFVDVFIAGEYDDGIQKNSTWATGDWNCDGEFDSEDIVAAFVAGAYVTEASAAATNGNLTRLSILALDARQETRRTSRHLAPQPESRELPEVTQRTKLTVLTHDRIFAADDL